jgi:hypothetical protein
MARIYGNISNYLPRTKKWYKFWAFYAALLILPCIAVMLLLNIAFRNNSYLGLAVIGGAYILMNILFKVANMLKNRAWGYKLGLNGEKWVLKELQNLPDEYAVIPDIHLPGEITNIDCVVVGPTGLFLIETKNVGGEIKYNGKFLTANSRKMENKDVLNDVKKSYLGLHNYLKTQTGQEFFVIPVIILATKHQKVHFGFTPVAANIRVIHVYKLLELIRTQSNCTFQLPQTELELIIQKLQKL